MTWSMIRNSDLDADTTERMLRGAVAPDDAPTALAGTAALLQAARGPLAVADPAAEERTVAAMVAAIGSSAPARITNRRSTMNMTTKLAAGTAVGVISLFGGLTAASALSGSVSSDVTNTTGVSLPFAATTHHDSDVSHATAADTDNETENDAVADTDEPKSTAADTEKADTEKTESNSKSTDNHGACVSKVAHEEFVTGKLHGEAVSTAAESECTAPKDSDTKTPTAPSSPTTTNHDGKGDTESSSSHGDATADAHAAAGQPTADSHRP